MDDPEPAVDIIGGHIIVEDKGIGAGIGKGEVLFTVNYNPEITNTHVIRYNGVLYDITRVEPFEGYKEDITLYCKRRARQ